MQQFKVTGYSALLFLVLCLSTNDGFLETDRRTLLRNIDARKNDQLTNRNFFGSTWQRSLPEEKRERVDTDSRRELGFGARLVRETVRASSLDNSRQTRDFRQIRDNNKRREREPQLYNSRLLGVSRRDTREDNLRLIDKFRRQEQIRRNDIRREVREDSFRRQVREREDERRSRSLDNSRRQFRVLEDSRRENQEENRRFNIRREVRQDSSRRQLREREDRGNSHRNVREDNSGILQNSRREIRTAREDSNSRQLQALDSSRREASSRLRSRLFENSRRENKQQDTTRREFQGNSSRRQLQEREDKRFRSLDISRRENNSFLKSRFFSNSRRQNQHKEQRNTVRKEIRDNFSLRQMQEREDERLSLSLDNSRQENSFPLQFRIFKNSRKENQHQKQRNTIRREIRDNSSRRQLQDREDERKSQSLEYSRSSRRQNQDLERRDTIRREVRDNSSRRQIREREDNRQHRLLSRNVREDASRSVDRSRRQSRLLNQKRQEIRDQGPSARRESRKIFAEIQVLDRRLNRDNDKVLTPIVSAVRRETRLVSDATRRIALSSKDENNNQRQSSGGRRMATSFRTTDNIDYIPEMKSDLLLNAAKVLLISFLVAQVAANSSKAKKYWFHNLTNFVTVTKEKVL